MATSAPQPRPPEPRVGSVLVADLRRSDRPVRVLIVSADIGEGHDAPARAIAADLRAECPSAHVTIANGLAEMGRFVTWVIREGSRVAFTRRRWLFEIQYFLITRVAPTKRLGVLVLRALGGRRLRRFIADQRPDVVISTYPGTTMLLGEYRRRGLLDAPAVGVITDLAGLYYWAWPGVDLHTITHPESIAEVRAIIGERGVVQWARPPSCPRFLEPCSMSEGRRVLELPQQGKIVVVSGGGWAVGDLAGAIEAALRTRAALVICLTGRNEQVAAALGERFGAEPRVRLMGFTNRMSELLAAADVLVHSSAGLTVLEAIVRGCPVISYGFGIGHVRVNNQAFARHGLARPVRSRGELGLALEQALQRRDDPDERFAERPSVAALVLELCGRLHAAASGEHWDELAAGDLVEDLR